MNSGPERSEKLRIHEKYIRRLYPFNVEGNRRRYELELNEISGWEQFLELERAIYSCDVEREYEQQLKREETECMQDDEERIERCWMEEMRNYIKYVRHLDPYDDSSVRHDYENAMDLMGPAQSAQFEELEGALSNSDARAALHPDGLRKFTTVEEVDRLQSHRDIMNVFEWDDSEPQSHLTKSKPNEVEECGAVATHNLRKTLGIDSVDSDIVEAERVAEFEKIYESALAIENMEEAYNADEDLRM